MRVDRHKNHAGPVRGVLLWLLPYAVLVLQVRVADDASVARLAARTVMVRRFVDLWASGDSWDTLAAAVRALSPEVYGEYLAEGTTFKVRAEANPKV